MRNTGQVYACDNNTTRLARLKPRLVRSGLSNVQPFAIDSEVDPKLVRLASKADAVLVDAPCSGFGTLRRNPDLKWRFKADDLERLVVQQASILQAASRLVRPGGWLVYATCSRFFNPKASAWAASWRLKVLVNITGWSGRPIPQVTAAMAFLRPGCDAAFRACACPNKWAYNAYGIQDAREA
ncbi:MAG: hypothetical protein EBT59_10680 [Betaproteobacteria bacterium]|nr:hypothetical protein [Betaproteobacteria bacterium]